MNWIIALISFAFLSLVSSKPPVFLERGGTKICTLNNIGKIPAGRTVAYPVYQKVCRHVIPTMGDPIDDEVDDELQNDELPERRIDMVRRAIFPSWKNEKVSNQKSSLASLIKVQVVLNKFRVGDNLAGLELQKIFAWKVESNKKNFNEIIATSLSIKWI